MAFDKSTQEMKRHDVIVAIMVEYADLQIAQFHWLIAKELSFSEAIIQKLLMRIFDSNPI